MTIAQATIAGITRNEPRAIRCLVASTLSGLTSGAAMAAWSARRISRDRSNDKVVDCESSVLIGLPSLVSI